jgi:predicted RNA-binding protein YlxR (DUF448 family)
MKRHPPRPRARPRSSATSDVLTSLEAEDTGPVRRCLVTGEVRAKPELIRFVVGPDGRIHPDVAERLPGRGLWTLARRDIVRRAVKKGLFGRAARATVGVDEDLDQRVEALLVRRAIDLIGLARRAGLAVCGFAKVEAALNAGRAAVLVAAADGSADGRGKLRARAPGLPLAEALTAAELGAAFGRESAVHAVLQAGSLAQTFLAVAGRLAGFRGMPASESNTNVTLQGTSIGPR